MQYVPIPTPDYWEQCDCRVETVNDWTAMTGETQTQVARGIGIQLRALQWYLHGKREIPFSLVARLYLYLLAGGWVTPYEELATK